MPRKSIERHLRVAIITVASNDNGLDDCLGVQMLGLFLFGKRAVGDAILTKIGDNTI